MEAIKKTLGILLIVLTGILILNQVKVYRGSAQTMSVSGTGKVTAVPDLAMVNIGVITQGETPEAVRVASTQSMNSIISYLKGLSIDSKDIQTANFTTSPRYQYQSGKNTIIGYEANQTVSVMLRHVDVSQKQLETVLSQVTQVGANNIQGVRFSFSNEDDFKQQATKQAIEKAKQSAQQLTTDAGLKLVKLVNIIPAQTDSSIMPMAYAMAAKSNAITSDIEPGSQDVSSTVTLVYEVR